ncbi:glycosyltransferase [Mycolicibacterium sp. 120266]|uniref:glycosyltransferase n=1 Tax=Mycolicibacterium sp. 120266 TaxID=3090601 RepID=UPI00299D21DF|nr:glycosyltransferase [Mycolicibacterium sp. 120266]MDX1874363.1 glycosyltransferase [Mycolicibacterium sp. 120266]
MSRISIIAVGSRGDVAPLAGLGAELKRRGHDVAVTAYSPFASMIMSCGLTFRELPAALDDGEDPTKGLAAFAAPSGMRTLDAAILRVNADQATDLLLLSPFAEMAGHPLAEAKGIPALGVRMQPLSATAAHPPAILGGGNLGARGNKLAAEFGAGLFDLLYGGVVADLRRSVGLPKVSARALRRLRTGANWTVLHGYSTSVAPRPADWRTGLEVTGYWRPPRDPSWTPPDELARFLAAGPPPVFVGLGSVVVSKKRSRVLSELIVRAAELAGVRVLIQAGWAGLHAATDGVLTIGDAPHDWLFPHMAAVAHHCGAGTTAAGLRAGVPTVALPGYGDGPFWARRLREIGACATVIPQRRLTAERLADGFRAALDPALRVTTERIGAQIRSEDGAARAASIIERHLR